MVYNIVIFIIPQPIIRNMSVDTNIKKRSRSANPSKSPSCSPNSSDHRNSNSNNGYRNYYNCDTRQTNYNQCRDNDNCQYDRLYRREHNNNHSSYRGYINNHDSYNRPPSVRRAVEYKNSDRNMYHHFPSPNDDTSRYELN